MIDFDQALYYHTEPSNSTNKYKIRCTSDFLFLLCCLQLYITYRNQSVRTTFSCSKNLSMYLTDKNLKSKITPITKLLIGVERASEQYFVEDELYVDFHEYFFDTASSFHLTWNNNKKKLNAWTNIGCYSYQQSRIVRKYVNLMRDVGASGRFVLRNKNNLEIVVHFKI